MADLMALLGKRFRDEKARMQGDATDAVAAVTAATAAAAAASGSKTSVGARRDRDMAGDRGEESGTGEMDSVARKLDFLSLM